MPEIDAVTLAKAIRLVESRREMEWQREGMPPSDGPTSEWYDEYAADVAREYERLRSDVEVRGG